MAPWVTTRSRTMNTCMNTSASREATWEPSMKTKTAAPAGASASAPARHADEQPEPQDARRALLDQAHRPQAAPGVLALGQALEVGPGEAGERGGHHEAGQAEVEEQSAPTAAGPRTRPISTEARRPRPLWIHELPSRRREAWPRLRLGISADTIVQSRVDMAVSGR